MKRKICLKKSVALAVSATLATGSISTLNINTVNAENNEINTLPENAYETPVTLPADLTDTGFETPVTLPQELTPEEIPDTGFETPVTLPQELTPEEIPDTSFETPVTLPADLTNDSTNVNYDVPQNKIVLGTTNITPEDNSENIAVDTSEIVMQFDDSIDTSDLGQIYFSDNSKAINQEIVYNSDNTNLSTTQPEYYFKTTNLDNDTIVINLPEGTLLNGTQYTFVVSGFKGLNNNEVMEEVVLTFTTTSNNLTAQMISPEEDKQDVPSYTDEIIIGFEYVVNTDTDYLGSIVITDTDANTEILTIDNQVNSGITYTLDDEQNPTKTIATITLSELEQEVVLQPETNYSVTVSGYTDLSGNVMTEDYVANFKTDVARAVVIGSSVDEISQNVPINTRTVSVYFDQDMTIEVPTVTLNDGKSTVKLGYGSLEAAPGSPAGSTDMLTIKLPTLTPSTNYTLSISGLYDKSSNTEMQPSTINFKTSPAVLSTTPKDDAYDVVDVDPIEIQFSERVDSTDATVTVSPITPNGKPSDTPAIEISNGQATGATFYFRDETEEVIDPNYGIVGTSTSSSSLVIVPDDYVLETDTSYQVSVSGFTTVESQIDIESEEFLFTTSLYSGVIGEGGTGGNGGEGGSGGNGGEGGSGGEGSQLVAKPVLIETYPVKESYDAKVNEDIILKFQVPVGPSASEEYPSTVIITNNESGEEVSSTFKFDESNPNNVIVTPDKPLDYNTEYTVTVSGFAHANNPSKIMGYPKSFTFTTEVDPSTIIHAPVVITMTPPNGATKVDTLTSIKIEFDQLVNTKNGKVSIYDSNQNEVLVDPQVTSGSALTYTITPTEPLEYDTTYTVVVEDFVSYADPSQVMVPVESSFTTVAEGEEPVDPTLPKVLSTSVSGNDVSPSTKTITILFDQPMDTISKGTLTVTDSSTGKVVSKDGKFVDETTYVVSLNPLKGNTTYTIEMSGFSNVFGAEMEEYSSTFSTKGKSPSDETGSIGGGSVKPETPTTTKPATKEPAISEEAESITVTNEEISESIENGTDVTFEGEDFTYVMPIENIEYILDEYNINLDEEDVTITMSVESVEITEEEKEKSDIEGTSVSKVYKTNIYLNTNKDSIEIKEFPKPVSLTVPVESTGTVLYGVTVDEDGNSRVVPANATKNEATLSTMTNDEYIYVVENEQTFADVEGNWSEEYVNEAASREFVDGEALDVYNPEEILTRAEFTKMVVDAYSIPLVTDGTTSYSDVDSEEWYYDYVVTAEQAGLLTFAEGSTFDPMAPMTREEMAVILENVSEYTNEEQTSDVNSLDEYSDGSEVNEMYEESFAWAVENGIIEGLDEAEGIILSPQGTLTRGQGAAVLIRSMEYNGFIN